MNKKNSRSNKISLYQLISWELDHNCNEYMVSYCAEEEVIAKKVSASIISKNPQLIQHFSVFDANRIGYMAGLNDTYNER